MENPLVLRAFALSLLLVSTACGQAEPPAGTGRRVAAVKAEKPAGAANDGGGFCEKAYPTTGPEARRFEWPPLQPLPVPEVADAPAVMHGWLWVNVWATWCQPCLAEMALLGKWTRALDDEGRAIRLELLTIDVAEQTEALKQRLNAGLPGRARWLRSEADFGPFLDLLGVDRHAAIPIHALVDPQGMLRCVRVGAISGQDYAAIKGILTGG